MAIKKWDAQSYSNNSQLQYLASKKFFSTLSLDGSEVILDIGCGTGLLTSEISQKVLNGKAIGIDSSDNMINYAAKHYQFPNLEFKLMRAEELNFPFMFDVIVSSFCLHWIKDKQELFYRIAKHLHPEGITRLIMPFKHEQIAQIRHKVMCDDNWTQYFSDEAIKEVLIFDNKYDVYANNAGLDNLGFQTEDVKTHFANPTELKAFLKNVTAYIDKLPTQEMQDAFMQEVIDLYLKNNPPLEDGTCSITYTYGKISSKGVKQKAVK